MQRPDNGAFDLRSAGNPPFADGSHHSGRSSKATGSAEQLDARELRRAFGRFATGVAIATTMGPNGPVGMTINSFSSVSLTPPLILWSLRKDASALRSFLDGDAFAINVLSISQRPLATRFASKEPNKFDRLDIRPGSSGAPLLSDCIAYFECHRSETISCGDHYLLIGGVQAASYHDGDPLLFSSGAFGAATPLPC